MNDTYKKLQIQRNNLIDINLEQLKDIVLFDIVTLVNNIISDKQIDKISKYEQSIDNTSLTYNDIDNIINDFLKTTNYKYKDLYKNLKDEGRVFFTDLKNNSSGSCYNDINYNSDYSYIIINKNQSIIQMCITIAHEVGHIIENLELKDKNIKEKDYFNFNMYSVFNEIKAVSFATKCIDYLENINLDKTTIKKYRVLDFFNTYLGYVNDVALKKRDLYSIKRVYAMIINNYLSSIVLPSKKDKLEKIYDENKLLDNDIKILEKLKCNDQKIK